MDNSSGLDEKHLSQVEVEINNLKERQHSKVELQSLPNRSYLDNTVVPILITGEFCTNYKLL